MKLADYMCTHELDAEGMANFAGVSESSIRRGLTGKEVGIRVARRIGGATAGAVTLEDLGITIDPVERLRAARITNSQLVEIAERCGVMPLTVASWIHRIPHPKSVRKLGEALDAMGIE